MHADIDRMHRDLFSDFVPTWENPNPMLEDQNRTRATTPEQQQVVPHGSGAGRENRLGVRRASPMFGFAPRWDVRDYEDRLTVHADLPGVKKEDVKIEVRDGMLRLSGQREEASEEKGENEQWFVRERTSGKFTRALRLPETANQEDIKAKFTDGVLEVTVPKLPPPEHQARQINIE
uniref:SHSP domain-containing protein n=1 Tax=Chromera velia CCMP2878 TaxID=1169474 RepID=A0A0G4FBB6_9ALVE|eukprot:Cvel_3057.t1-p1 / transcript=Cvel_3057.t1 / gene=Cvel_3057 / organism=Chromera_velia_CCMP2878 / gene_product=17.6 kDa class I heat shock protein 3, putative / transcript_product=17.6 kDa class I heat shock protein 3, putative / location=Cvel_scaffold122:43154-43681(-) / protein_length=176 / sequence_SO=supercontig / SO=protein_coding / is_pseudo=false